MFLIKILIKNLKTVLLLLFCLFSGIILTSFHKDDPKTIKTIVIDPGHGGDDPGCSGINNKEKDISLAVALRVGKLIEEHYPEIKVIYTRKTDVFVSLEDRAMVANKAKADLFLCIHCNAAGKPVMIRDKKTKKMRPKTYVNKKGKRVVVETTNPIPFGSETYVMGLKNEEGKMKVAQRENSAMLLEDNYEEKYQGFDPESEESYIIMSNYTTAYLMRSVSLAMKIQEEYGKKAGRVDKGVHRQSIWVLWRTAMPSILTEIGYLTNPLEEQFLASEKGQTYISASIFKGFRRYKDEVEGNKKTYDDELENMTALENENLKAGNTGKTPKVEEDYEVEDEKDSVKTVATNNIALKKDSVKTIPTNTIAIIKDTTVKSSPTIAITPKKEEIKKDSVKIVKQKDEPRDKDAVEFKVQFMGSETLLDLKEKKFDVIENGWYYKVGNIYKYTSGNFKTMAEAFRHQKKLSENGFKDCFVVAFKNGERIDLKQAKLLAKE